MAISIADGFQYLGKKSLDSRTSYTTLALMKAVSDSNINEGCLAYCEETDKYYKFLSSNTVDADTGKWREYSSGGGSYTAGDGIDITNDVISTDNMQSGDIADCLYPLPSPEPGVSSLGGLTDVVITDPEEGNAIVYDGTLQKWVNGQGGKVYTAGDGINIDANDEISTDNMQSADMEDVLDTLPGIESKYHKYSTTEQIVGEWINGEPIYEKTFEINNPSDNSVIYTGVVNLIGCSNLVWISSVGAQTWSNCGWFAANDNYTFRFQINSNSTDLKLRVTNNTALTITKLYVTLTYTKS